MNRYGGFVGTMVILNSVNPRAIRELDHIYEYIANEKLASENAKGQLHIK